MASNRSSGFVSGVLFGAGILVAGMLGAAVAQADNHEEAAPRVPPAEDLCAPVARTSQAATGRQSRRRPGASSDGDGRRPEAESDVPVMEFRLRTCDPTAIPPYTTRLEELGTAIPDRWRIMDAFYEENLLDPYANNNWLKGDKPIFGKDWFASLLMISDTVIEPRRFPVPVGVSSTRRAGQLDTIGNGQITIFNQALIIEGVLLKGDTVFRPPDWEFRFTPVLNFNRVEANEVMVLDVRPDGVDERGTLRKEGFFGVQALFVDKHLRNVSDRFDFDSIRIGIQPFSSDFRGFLFQDSQFGVRLFGNRDNNIFQYNLAWFRRLEKDTNSGLNDISQKLRDDDVFIANLYWQDMPVLGFQSQATIIYNRNREKGDVKFDDNGFIARPSSLFEERFSRNYDVVYYGFNGDGHFDRWNLTTSFYYVNGEQTSERFPNAEEEVESFFFAAEASRDFDWIRVRASAVWGRGDDDPFDDKAEGFDAIFENPQIAGSDTSYWIRQTVPLIGGGGVILSGRNGLLNSLRSTKELGQSNFKNPGIRLLGIGADFDLSPHLRVSVNANQLWFDKVGIVERLRQQGNIDREIGQDVSVALIWRPLVSQNIVVRLSAAALIPGEGFDNLYSDDEETPYSVLANIIFQY